MLRRSRQYSHFSKNFGALVNAGFPVYRVKRFLIVVPSQTHGRLLPYETGHYAPTWVEYSIVIGLMALGALAMVLFFKIFPIMEIREPGEISAVRGVAGEEARDA